MIVKEDRTELQTLIFICFSLFNLCHLSLKHRYTLFYRNNKKKPFNFFHCLIYFLKNCGYEMSVNFSMRLLYEISVNFR